MEKVKQILASLLSMLLLCTLCLHGFTSCSDDELSENDPSQEPGEPIEYPTEDVIEVRVHPLTCVFDYAYTGASKAFVDRIEQRTGLLSEQAECVLMHSSHVSSLTEAQIQTLAQIYENGGTLLVADATADAFLELVLRIAFAYVEAINDSQTGDDKSAATYATRPTQLLRAVDSPNVRWALQQGKTYPDALTRIKASDITRAAAARSMAFPTGYSAQKAMTRSADSADDEDYDTLSLCEMIGWSNTSTHYIEPMSNEAVPDSVRQNYTPYLYGYFAEEMVIWVNRETEQTHSARNGAATRSIAYSRAEDETKSGEFSEFTSAQTITYSLLSSPIGVPYRRFDPMLISVIFRIYPLHVSGKDGSQPADFYLVAQNVTAHNSMYPISDFVLNNPDTAHPQLFPGNSVLKGAYGPMLSSMKMTAKLSAADYVLLESKPETNPNEYSFDTSLSYAMGGMSGGRYGSTKFGTIQLGTLSYRETTQEIIKDLAVYNTQDNKTPRWNYQTPNTLPARPIQVSNCTTENVWLWQVNNPDISQNYDLTWNLEVEQMAYWWNFPQPAEQTYRSSHYEKEISLLPPLRCEQNYLITFNAESDEQHEAMQEFLEHYVPEYKEMVTLGESTPDSRLRIKAYWQDFVNKLTFHPDIWNIYGIKGTFVFNIDGVELETPFEDHYTLTIK